MDNLKKYGIKEVCDVTLYELDQYGNPTFPVLYLDSLKTSNLEITAESVDAVGGKGASKLLTWDYGRDITINITDALFSMKSLWTSLKGYASDGGLVRHILQFTGTTVPETFEGPNGQEYIIPTMFTRIYDMDGNQVTTDQLVEDQSYYYCFMVGGDSVQGITISATSFSKNYYFVGDTYARDSVTNKDSYCQFIIPKFCIDAGGTITLEADGEPTTFDFTGRALYTKGKPVVKIVLYDVDDGPSGDGVPIESSDNLLLIDQLDRQLIVEFSQGD